MLGNDVVDLADAEAALGATHPRFDDRVFTTSERTALSRSASPNRLRWFFWAAKESAFKAARKLDPRVVFSPRRFEVTAISETDGMVTHGRVRWRIRAMYQDDAIHSVAQSERAEPIVAFVRVGRADDLSAAVRRLAIDEIARHLAIAPERLAIVRHGRIPALVLDGEPTAWDLSLAHHGAVVGFAAAPVPRGVA